MTNPSTNEPPLTSGFLARGSREDGIFDIKLRDLRRSALTLAAWLLAASTLWSQTIYTPSSGFPSAPGGAGSAPLDIPQTNLAPIAPPANTYAPPANAYGSFDPYAIPPTGYSGGSSLSAAPTYAPPATGGSPFGLFPSPSAPPMSSAGFGTPVDNPPIFGPSPSAAGGVAQPPTFPSSIYPQSTPNTLFPDGLGPMYSGSFLTNPSATAASAFRLLQGPRFRYAYVTPGSEPENLGMNDFDFSLAFAFPKFFHSSQPFFVVPSFSLHLWDGPDGIIGADLPANAYSAFVDFGWESDPNQMFGTEIGIRPGVFTDFDTYTSDSFRVRGKALATFRITPTSTIKAGAYYADRNEIKLVPALGIFCRPNPFTRIDLFFPQPRYAHYCRTVGVYDLWCYATTDLGGGSWTIERAEGYEDSVDINDYRAILGLEFGPTGWAQSGRRIGFAELGYVFHREVRYRYSPQDDFDPDDALMFRIGIGY